MGEKTRTSGRNPRPNLVADDRRSSEGEINVERGLERLTEMVKPKPQLALSPARL